MISENIIELKQNIADLKQLLVENLGIKGVETESAHTLTYLANEILKINVGPVPPITGNTPLCFTAIDGDATLELTTNFASPVFYKSSDGTNWESWNYSIISILDGQSVYIKGDNANGWARGGDSSYSTFVMTGDVACEGNIMSLLGDDITEIPCGYCFCKLFSGCTSLLTAPELPATVITEGCYEDMFNGCSNLASVPELPATVLASRCYNGMFWDCTSLTTAPELPATELANDCYAFMFDGCSSLTTAPELPAETLKSGCYQQMFYGCSNISEITMLAKDISAFYSRNSWVSGVAPTGTFHCAQGMSTVIPRGTNGIPSGWIIVEDGRINEPLCFTALETGTTLSLSNSGNTPTMYKSTDGTHWESWDYSAISIPSGQSVYIKGDNPRGFSSYVNEYSTFNGTGKFSCSGNVMSLLGEGIGYIPCNYCFYKLFQGCTSLTNAPELPETELTEGCYASMFKGCTSLTNAPELPATTLAISCYGSMFENCTSLTSITMLATDISASSCLTRLTVGVASTGTFYCASGMSTVIPRGYHGIPNGWNVVEV